jgi:hypothetical protein
LVQLTFVIIAKIDDARTVLFVQSREKVK